MSTGRESRDPQNPRPQTFVPVHVRLICWGFAAVLAMCAMVGPVVSTNPSGRIVGPASFAVGSGFMAWFGSRSRVTLSADTLTVVNLFQTHVIPLKNIEQIGGGRMLTVSVKGRPPVRAFAVGNSNLSFPLGREGYADRIAAELRRLIASS